MISVVIPTYNDEDTIERCLDSVLDQSYDGDYEVIVVDSSDDSTPEIVADYPVKLVQTKPQGPGVARNRGVEEAEGEIVAFTDADCRVDRDWLRSLVSEMENRDAEAVGGICKTPEDVSLFQRLVGYELDYRFERMEEGPVNRLPTMNLAVKRSVFEELDGFDTDLKTSEDYDFGYRLNKKGYEMVHTKNAVVQHYHRTGLVDYAKQKFSSTSYVPVTYFESPSGLTGDQINSLLMISQPVIFGLLVLSTIGYFIYPFLYIPVLLLFVLLNLTFAYKTAKIYTEFGDPKTLLLFFLQWYWVVFVTLGLLNGFKNLLKHKLG